MDIDKAKFDKLLNDLKKLTLLDAKNCLEEEKFKLLMENVELFKEFYVSCHDLWNSNRLKTNHPAFHKDHGNVLVLKTFLSLEKEKFQHGSVTVLTTKGEQKSLPYAEVMPYGDMTNVLYQK